MFFLEKARLSAGNSPCAEAKRHMTRAIPAAVCRRTAGCESVRTGRRKAHRHPVDPSAPCCGPTHRPQPGSCKPGSQCPCIPKQEKTTSEGMRWRKTCVKTYRTYRLYPDKWTEKQGKSARLFPTRRQAGGKKRLLKVNVCKISE